MTVKTYNNYMSVPPFPMRQSARTNLVTYRNGRQWLNRTRALKMAKRRQQVQYMTGYILRPRSHDKCTTIPDIERNLQLQPATELSTQNIVAKHLKKMERKRQAELNKFKKRKARLQEIDAANGTNYYERYLRKRCAVREKHQAMGDRVNHAGSGLCCVIL